MALQTPSPTLYVTNLEGKTKKPELRSSLYALFTPYGKVIDIVAKKHDKGRGQAFVVFSEQVAATAAMRGLTGEHFYGKSLGITYAKTPSHATLALIDPSKSKEAAAIAAAKAVVSKAQDEYNAQQEDGEGKSGKRELEDGSGAPAAKRARQDDDDDEEMEIEMDEDDDDAAPSTSAGSSLICTNLPQECTEQIMGALFGQYPGVSKITTLPASQPAPSSHPLPNADAKSFRVTFASRDQANAALGPTNKYEMQPGWNMSVSLE